MFSREKFLLKILVELLQIPSVTGNTEKIIQYIIDQFSSYPNITITKNQKGGLIITLDGTENEKVITVSGHIDTLGAMVNSIKGNGNLEITQIGGYDWNSIEGENCIVHSFEKEFTGTIVLTKGSTHVFGSETSKTVRDQSTLEVRLDEKVMNKEDVEKLGIRVGDFVSFDPRTVITPSGYIKSRHLDDKGGVAVILTLLKDLLENNTPLKNRVHFLISNYEEVGHGSSGIPTDTTEIIAVDMGVVGGNQQGSEHHVSICAKDSSGPYDLNLRREFVSICEKLNIPYKIDIYPYYGSDASAALRAGHNIKAGLIGPGVANSHGYERTHKDALSATFNLLYAYLTK
ncbi:M42 family metallopeptidase [Anaerobranca gottschalkii]|uniref:Aminopeptidase FrvX n=1 Tax=Anaerobranca gottschalkii DSM 13577 TaxID=1120990 RepID=A0A1H9YTR2_9FIRM|nr:M42 family metallopeptidase [Anaerobranca gottschalkii]SES72549.1 Putative aminopeptidase FrvX [Anaerobranca gottschalkii DSM 13577]